MKNYIGCKIVAAEPMDEFTFASTIRNTVDAVEIQEDGSSKPGYHILYPDGYHSWCPKNVFEEAYREISKQEEWLQKGIAGVKIEEFATPIKLVEEK